MKETDAKLKRWSKFLRFEHIIGNDGYAWLNLSTYEGRMERYIDGLG